MPNTGADVGGWLFGGLGLMLAATALMRAATRRPA
jgi:LPXTG-motif cell wall-anchored protein